MFFQASGQCVRANDAGPHENIPHTVRNTICGIEILGTELFLLIFGGKAALTDNPIQGLTFDTICLSRIDMGENDRFQGPLFDPSAYCGVVDAQNVCHFRDSQ